MAECRLLIDPPCSGAWNMAVDEVLLEWALEDGGCCWRFYGWDVPTLSLGYFQEHDRRLEHAASRNCPAVRRLTGGGAIVHDVELTYSLVVPGGHPLATRRNLLYETVHNSLIETLAEHGVRAALCRASERRAKPDEEPFLCFQRRAPGDVLAGETKIAGSAQRRRRRAVLQHGSVLLGRSLAAPELEGLEKVAGRPVGGGELSQAWLVNLARCLNVTWRHQPLSQRERAGAAKLAESRYAAARWTRHRGR